MENYVYISNRKHSLTDEQAGKIRKMLGLQDRRLSTVQPGEVVQIGAHQMVVLEQSGDTTALICKKIYRENVCFGRNNNYDGSTADKICEEFADEIAAVVGRENIVTHTVNLTTDDGLKDYGKIRRPASLLTTERYRRYVDVLDQFKPECWWWLSTAFSTKRHESPALVKCVAPSGCVDNYACYRDSNGVRPFCILKSNIFVS